MAQDYFTILTLLGKAKVADAIANGTDIDLSEIAVGDGNYTPTEGQTALVNEIHRAAANQVIRDTENTNWIIAELVIPSETGGFSVREVGIFDAAGDLFAIGKYPETYKPTFDQGSGKELVIRIILEVSNQADVNLSVDPTVVTATRDYVDGQIDGLATATETYVAGQIGAHKAENGAHDAANVDYDNTASGLSAETVQAAIDEVENQLIPATEEDQGLALLASATEAAAGTNTTKAVTPSGVAAAMNARLGDVALFVDEKPAGTNGGTNIGGLVWAARTLNTTIVNHISGASLSSNQVTLPAGTYYLQAWSCGDQISINRARIYNATDSTMVDISPMCHTSTAGLVAWINTYITITEPKTFRVEYAMTASVSSRGLGLGSTEGVGRFCGFMAVKLN